MYAANTVLRLECKPKTLYDFCIVGIVTCNAFERLYISINLFFGTCTVMHAARHCSEKQLSDFSCALETEMFWEDFTIASDNTSLFIYIHTQMFQIKSLCIQQFQN